MVLGVLGVGGVGAATYVGVGTSQPDDFMAVVSKSPQAVYAAFSALGPAGEINIPSPDGWGSGLRQRIVKVANEQVKLEVEVNGQSLITAEIQLTPEGEGTRIAAELDFNQEAMSDLMRQAGGSRDVPTMAFEEYLIDQAFAKVMEEAVSRIEEGKPLRSLSETRAGWGQDGSTRGSRPSARGSGSWQQRQAVRPQLDARPTLDPNAAAREQTSRGSSYSY